MGAAEVRKVLAAYFAPPAIPGLATVYRGFPVTLQGSDWPIGSDTAWGAGSYLSVRESREKRISVGGAHGGIKKLTFECALVVFFRWQFTDHGPYNQTDGWVDPFDNLMDALKVRLRADRTLGCGSEGPVWQAGEGDGEGESDDVRVLVDDAQVDEDSGQVVVWAALEFTVVEMLAQS